MDSHDWLDRQRQTERGMDAWMGGQINWLTDNHWGAGMAQW